MEFHTINIDLEPDSDPDMIGQEYRAIIMAHEDNGNQYNTGYVIRENTPEKAFKKCLDMWKKR